MGCRLITSPLTGKEVQSRTWSDIRSLVQSDERADELYEQLLSPDFISWFGDWINDPRSASKVVNEHGEPLMVYHGSDAHGFSVFDKGKLGDKTNAPSARKGFFFASNKEASREYLVWKVYEDVRDSIMRSFEYTMPDADWNSMDQAAEDAFMSRYQDDADGIKRREEIREIADFQNLINAEHALQEGLIDKRQYLDIKEEVRAKYQVDSNIKKVRDKLVINQLDGLLQFFPKDDYGRPTINGIHITAVEMLDIRRALVKQLDWMSGGEKWGREALSEERNALDTLIYPLFLNIKDPLEYNYKGRIKRVEKYANLIDAAKRKENDGVMLINTYDPTPTDIYVAFEPNQIKSIFNQGGFSEESDNIYEDPLLDESPTRVRAKLKVLNALDDPKIEGFFNRFFKTNPNKFYQEVTPFAGKYQVSLLKDWIEDNDPKTLDDIKVGLAADLSYTVEVNVATKKGINYSDPENYDEIYGTSPEERNVLNDRVKPTQYYSNLTVPGGTNYTENEIRVPDITPAIKGHAQFSTDQGIGWFRSDDEGYGNFVPEAIGEPYDAYTEEEGYTQLQDYTIKPRTRRILEVQSDLFQKGRDKEDLIGVDVNEKIRSEYGEDYVDQITDEYRARFDKSGTTQNSFLQVLNKEGNWIKFFIQSIVQDSARKGYEKVLFPLGDTASKVEGHETLEDFMRMKKNRLEELKKIEMSPHMWAIRDNDPGMIHGDEFPTGEAAINYLRNSYGLTETEIRENYEIYRVDVYGNEFRDPTIEIARLEKEIKDVEENGLAKLRPIWTFYETTVSNNLRKIYGKNGVRKVTDEHGNSWNEVRVDPIRDRDVILFDESYADEDFSSKKDFKELPFKYNVSKLVGSTIVLQPRSYVMGTYKDSNSDRIVNLVPAGRFTLKEILASTGLTEKKFIKQYITSSQKNDQYIKDFLKNNARVYVYRLDSVNTHDNVLPEIDDPRFAKFYDNRRRTIDILKGILRNERDPDKRKVLRDKIRDLEEQARFLEKDESRTLGVILDMLNADIDAVEDTLNNNPDWRSLNYASSLISNYHDMLEHEFKDTINMLSGESGERVKMEIISFINRLTDLSKQIQDKIFDIGNVDVKDRTGKNVVANGVLVSGIDIGRVSREIEDSTTNINPLVQTITYMIKQAIVKIDGRYNKFMVDHKKLVDSLIRFQKSKGTRKEDYYEFMLQRDSNNQRTGYVIDKLSRAYFDAREESRKTREGELLFYAQNHKFNVDQELWKKKREELVQWYKDTNPEFGTLKPGDEAYGATPESKLNYLANRFAEKYNPNTMVSIMDRINKNPKLVTPGDIAYFNYFLKNGGFRTAYVEGKRVDILKYDATAKWHDPKYNDLMKLPKTDPRRMFYSHYTDQINRYRVATREENFKFKWNYIPEKTKKMPIMSVDNFRQYMVDNLSQITSSNIHGIDPITGEISKAIPLYMFRGQVSAENKEYDLGSVLSSSTKEYMQYEEKKAIEDDANLLLYMLKKQKVAKLNPDGSQVVIDGEPQYKEGVSNNYEQAKYRLDAQLYDERQAKELVSRTKMFDVSVQKDLKKLKAQMDALKLSQPEMEDAHNHFNQGVRYTGSNKKIAEYIKLLQQRASMVNANVRYVTGNKAANLLMYFTSVKMLGLNLFAGIGELLQGFFSLITESAGKRWFNDTEAFRSLGIMMSISNPFGSQTKDKVNGLAKIFGSQGRVFQDSEQDNAVSKIAFALYAGSNYIMNNSFMLATLMHEKVKGKSGKEYNFYDNIEVKDGIVSWTNSDIDIPLMDEDGTPSDYLVSLIFRFKEVLKNNRERQTSDDPIVLEKKILGRALGQFKKNWLFRAIYSRYGEHREADEFSGQEFKGYYRTVLDLMKPEYYEDPITGEMSTGVGGVLKGVLKGSGQILRATAAARLLGMGLKKGELSDLDTSNLYKFVREMSFVITIGLTIALLSAHGDDDDDDRSWYRTWAINQLIRLQRDLTTYISPSSLESIVKNPAPVLGTVRDIVGLLDALRQSTIMLDPYQYEGTSRERLRLEKATTTLIPFVNQVDKMSNKLNKTINYTY